VVSSCKRGKKTFRVHKMRAISKLVKKLLASEEKLCCLELLTCQGFISDLDYFVSVRLSVYPYNDSLASV